MHTNPVINLLEFYINNLNVFLGLVLHLRHDFIICMFLKVIIMCRFKILLFNIE